MTEATEQVKKLCPMCRSDVDADARFCKYCAFNLSSSSDKQTASAEKKRSPATSKSLVTGITIVLVAAAIILAAVLFGNRRNQQSATGINAPAPPTVSSNVGTYSGVLNPTIESTPKRALTSSQVEAAVAEMVSGYRLSGSVRVKGVREIPQENSAIADLQFESFEYPVSFEGGLLRVKDFKPPKPSGSAIPPPEEMFPPRKVTYSKDGRAVLSKYTDGRWVLKSVGWGFDTSVKGSVEIR